MHGAPKGLPLELRDHNPRELAKQLRLEATGHSGH